MHNTKFDDLAQKGDKLGMKKTIARNSLVAGFFLDIVCVCLNFSALLHTCCAMHGQYTSTISLHTLASYLMATNPHLLVSIIIIISLLLLLLLLPLLLLKFVSYR